MTKLDEIIELNYLEKQNRKNRLEDKFKKNKNIMEKKKSYLIL